MAGTSLIDPNFFRTVVFVVEHDEEGAFGLVLNQPSEEPVAAHIPELTGAVGDPAVVFVGGPVQPQAATGYRIAGDGDEDTIRPGVVALDFENLDPFAQSRVFAGYAGWGPGQLEMELAEDAWIVVEPMIDDLFSPSPGDLWESVLRRQGGRLALLATYPPDPSLN